MLQRHGLFALLVVSLSMMAFACARGNSTRVRVPPPATELSPATKPTGQQTLVVGAGCFWCSEAVFEHVKGVTDVVSGYCGGSKETATYEQVSAGGTGHAESIRITYDPSKISYGTLLQIYFSIFDPTTKDYQGPDHGHQYRTVLFYQSPQQKRFDEAYIKQLDTAHVFPNPIVTTVEAFKAFYPAEAYHQDYVKHHPTDPYVQQNSIPKLKHLKERFPELYRQEP
jgi:peptide-methionine (S)-S-oxide reductase